MGTTIKDVAKAAGVSITTVSRVLNQYDDVNPKTRNKVLKTIKQLGYKPNNVARSLVMKRTQTIGLIISEMTRSRNGHHFMYDVICGINDRVQELGYDLFLYSTSPTMQKRTSYMDFVSERRVDGVILMGIRLDDPYMQEVVESSVASVLFDVPMTSETCSYVTTNNVIGAKMAVDHLIRQGHRKIGFVNGHEQAAVSLERQRGYEMALQMAGIALQSSLVYHADFERESSMTGTEQLHRTHPDMTAVFYASDMMAIGGVEYFQEQGISVPEQISIVGFDDIALASYVQPKLTTIRQNRYEMGKTSVDTLIRMLEEDEKGRGVILSPELVVRNSSGPYRL